MVFDSECIINQLEITTMITFGGFCRVTLVVASGFLPQNFRRWQGSMNGTLSFYKCRLSSGDTQRWWGHSTPTCCNQIHLNFLHLEAVGMLKHLPHAPHACSCPRSHLVNLSQHLIKFNTSSMKTYNIRSNIFQKSKF